MEIEIANPITADIKLNGSSLVAIMCRVEVKDGAVTLVIGDHVHYHAKATTHGGIRLLNQGPVQVKKTKPKKIDHEL